MRPSVYLLQGFPNNLVQSIVSIPFRILFRIPFNIPLHSNRIQIKIQ